MYIDKNRKLTKRQRKALRPPNEMVRRSLEQGKRFDIGSATYAGCEPLYTCVGQPGFEKWCNVAPGVPFVRLR